MNDNIFENFDYFSKVLSIVHSIDHEREKLFSKKIERIRSMTELKKTRKCQRQMSFI